MAYESINDAELAVYRGIRKSVFRYMVKALIAHYGCSASARKVGVPQDYMSSWSRTDRGATEKSFRLVQIAYERMKDEKAKAET